MQSHWIGGPRLRRLSWYIAAPLVGLILYWRVPFLWFVSDDFARLALPMVVHEHGLLHALFAPIAQGTVRVLSERLFFLTFYGLFGLHALPFLIWMLGTWVAVLSLILLIGAKLTRSYSAGLLAALICAANSNMVPAIIWPSAYYQLAGALCLLAALYARLRWTESPGKRWRVAEWVAYLAGFGMIEVTVVYPLLAALHALCFDRRRLRSTAWLFAPAILYTAMHFWWIPKSTGSVYALSVDGRMFSTFGKYLAWMLQPGSSALRSHAAALRVPEMIVGSLIGLALLVFLARRLIERRWTVAFFCGFFLLLLGPYLPLPLQVMPYYLTIPSIGLAWLAGWAISEAWRAGRWARTAAVALGLVYFVVSAAAINAQTRWFQVRGQRMRMVMEGVGAAVAAHPGSAVVLRGVDAALFDDGFLAHPFRLVGATQVWLAPGTAFPIPLEFMVSRDQLHTAVAQGQARVLELTSDGIRDTTASIDLAPPVLVDVGNPLQASQLGPSWYPAENGFRWAPKSATVRIRGPALQGQKLHVTGYAPGVLRGQGLATLVFSVDGLEIGRAAISKPEEPFSLDFALPGQLIGRESIEITVETSRTFRAPGDNRELGMVFGTFSVR